MDTDVLKSYLVNLGFAVNQPELRKFELALKDAAGMVEARTAGIVREVFKWQFAITTAFTGVSTAVVAMADHVANADQQYRLMGLRMFSSTESARKLTIGMKALGASMEEIAWDPELNERFSELSDLQDKWAQKLGPNFEKNMRSIRDLRFEVTKLQVGFEYLSMAFVSAIYEKLSPQLDVLKDKFEKWIDWAVEHMPELADFIADKLVPVLTETWSILKETGTAVGELATLFTNFIGVLSGDDSIEGTTFSFHKLAGGIEHVVGWVSTMIDTLIQAEQMLLHFANASVLVLGGHFADAKKEMLTGLQELTPGTGGTVGGIGGAGVGAGAGGWLGATYGAGIGAGIGTAILPGVGTALGAMLGGAFGGAVGTGTGVAAGGSLGGMVGSVAGEVNQNLQHGAGNGSGSDIASQARAAAVRIGGELGLDPRLIFEQWQHETGNFTSRISQHMNNLGGIRKAGSTDYRDFQSVDEYADFYAKLLQSKRYAKQGILEATNEEQFAGALKRGGYYEDSYDTYVKGMKGFGQRDASLFDGNSSGGDQTITVGEVNVHVMQPNASTEDVQKAATQGVLDAMKQQTTRTQAQLGFVG